MQRIAVFFQSDACNEKPARVELEKNIFKSGYTDSVKNPKRGIRTEASNPKRPIPIDIS